VGKTIRIVCLALVAALCGAGDDKVRDPQTGQAFDAQVQGAVTGVTLTCTGAGCRKKTALAVKVYAIAHWIDAQGARTALSEWQGRTGKDLAADQRFVDALSSADVEKRLALVFVRDLEAAKIRDAFKESLAASYPKGLSPAAEKFLGLFTADLTKGQSMEMRSLPGGVIEVRLDGAVAGRSPADRELAAAVWAIYFHATLADKHLEDVKRELVSRIEAIW
jgi:hypothetical protein